MPRMKFKPENFPVPEIYVFAIILSFLLRMFFPGQIFSVNGLGHIIGWPLSIIGVIISIWATSEAGKMSMAAPDRLITTGPYAYSRNPMYVGWTLLFLGLICVLNSLWSLALLVITLVYTHFFEIIPEEKSLKQKFGTQFEAYQKNVRRYI
jgi:protein-S-isoprenylcysteine O-methyltransferase Ste14